jgi:hypothetical protein
MSEFDDLLSEFLAGRDKLDNASLTELVRKFGVSAGDTEKICTMLHGFGYTDTQLEDVNQMAQIAQDFLALMPDETRKHIMDMAIDALSGLDLGEVPPEIRRFLETSQDAFGNPGKPEDET